MNKSLGSGVSGALGLPLDHLGVAVHSLLEGSRPYKPLGLVPDGNDEEIAAQGVRVRVFRCGESLVELLEPTTPESPIQRFLDKRGPGLHHLALRVEHLETEITRLIGEGAQFISTEPHPGRRGTRVIFLHPKWTGGVLVELIEHP